MSAGLFDDEQWDLLRRLSEELRRRQAAFEATDLAAKEAIEANSLTALALTECVGAWRDLCRVVSCDAGFGGTTDVDVTLATVRETLGLRARPKKARR